MITENLVYTLPAKFRAYDTKNEEFVYAELNPDWAGKRDFGSDAQNWTAWSQSTGLKDVDGREIYLGDWIVTWTTSSKGKVTYSKPRLVQFSRKYMKFNISAKSRYKIVGNIHQNPNMN